jgi:hypothetical protein
MHLAFHHSVGKQLSEPELNEDYSRPKQLFSKGPFAVSDGASESYDARTWSKLLVNLYIECPRFDETWVQEAVKRYAETHNGLKLSWSQEAAFERGSFATLLSLHLTDDGSQVNVLAVGDSISVLGEGDTFCYSFPYSSADQFNARPLLISTRADRNVELFNQDPTNFRITWQLAGHRRPRILAMTDALGAWLLTDPTGRFPILATLRSHAAFESLVESERLAGRMRRDDTTLLCLI